MNHRNFLLSYYADATEGIHVQRISKSSEAQKPHTHDYFQIYYVSAGSLAHYTQEASATLTRGDMFIIPPKTEHHIGLNGEVSFYTVSFMPEILGEPGACSAMAVHFLRTLETQQDSVRPVVTTFPEDTLHVEDLFQQMLSIFRKKVPGSNALLRAYCNLLVTLLAKTYYESSPEQTIPQLKNNRQAVLRGVSYIEQNYTEALTLEAMAKYCALSKSSFCDLFSQITGKTFHQYLNACRIHHACEYIRQGYQVTGIYGLCGYRDFSTFYRNFKKILGLSPEQFKKSLKT